MVAGLPTSTPQSSSSFDKRNLTKQSDNHFVLADACHSSIGDEVEKMIVSAEEFSDSSNHSFSPMITTSCEQLSPEVPSIVASSDSVAAAVVTATTTQTRGDSDNNNKSTNNKPCQEHRTGRWSLDEKILFLYGLNKFGKGRWKKMSIYLPHRSLVQIKSHAQKVLKRLDSGENVYRRMEENRQRLEILIAEAHKRVGLPAGGTTFTTAVSTNTNTTRKSKRKSRAAVAIAASKSSKNRTSSIGRGSEKNSHNDENRDGTNKNKGSSKVAVLKSSSNFQSGTNTTKDFEFVLDDQAANNAVIAAAALCQLSSCGVWAWGATAGDSRARSFPDDQHSSSGLHQRSSVVSP